MRGYWIRAALLALAVGMTGPALRAQQRSPAEVRLQAAIHTEEVEGNLQRAIELYREVVSRYGGERDVAARALLYLGRTYEKLGSQEATRAYQRVVREYGDQSQVAAQARARLTALQTAATPVAGHGPVARRLLTNEDNADDGMFVTMTPSPDGRRVAYIGLEEGREGHVFLRDLASGTEEQLLPGMPTVMHWSPTWSPDGTRLAFVEKIIETSMTTIKILDLASRAVTAVPGTEVPAAERRGALGMGPLAWSRDGHFLLYGYDPDGPSPSEIGIIPVSGGARRALAYSVGWGSLSPDGRYVTYTVGERGSEQVFVQPVGGGTRRQITSEPGGNRVPAWSPDGSAIAYFRRDGIWVVPVTRGNAAGAPRLAYASRTAFSWRSAAWTAAGGLYMLQSFDEGVPHRIAVDPATGAFAGAAERLPPYSVPGGGLVGSFKWSPDMQHTAFATGFGDIVIYGANGTSVASHTVAPYENLFAMSWSGDGREVFFSHYWVPAGAALAALEVASGRVREIARWTGRQVVRTVGADGRRLLLHYREDQDQATPEGLVVVEAGQPGGRLVAPAWDADSLHLKWRERMSAQGDRVAFSRSARRGSSDDESLWVVGSDGTGLRRIATIKEIGGVLWDPSGRFLAYAGRADSTAVVLRIVEVATDVERGSTRLPSELWGKFELSDWSQDGRFIGFVAWEPRMEYWVVQGLLGRER